MATLYTGRIIAVARTTFAQQANAAAATVDVAGGDQTFTVPLRNAGDATNTPVAMWCNWAMQDQELVSLRQALRDQGAKINEVVVIQAADKLTYSPRPADQCYVFDARWDVPSWTPEEVLAVMGMDTLESEII